MIFRRSEPRSCKKFRAGGLLLLAALVVIPYTSYAATPPGSDGFGAGAPGTSHPAGDGVPGNTGAGPGEEDPAGEINPSEVNPVTRFAAGEIPAERRQQLSWQAEQEGISIDEAIEKYAWQSPLAYLVNEIREEYPDDFAGARIEDDLSAWIAFSGAAPADAATSIRAFPRAVRIIENRGFTEADLDRRLKVVHRSVMDNDKVESAISTYDIATGRLTVDIALEDAESTPAEKAAVLDLLRADFPIGSVSNIGTSTDVYLNIVSSITGGEDAGGVHIGTCTAGFVLEHSSGTRNLSTAGHCPNRLTINDNAYDTRIALTFEDEHEGAWGDLQRHSAPEDHALVNTIRYGRGRDQFREITATGVPMEGEWLWKYGKSTGQTVDRVYRLNVSNGDHEGLVAMHNRKARGGDSGGPWFDGPIAYGIHSGHWWVPSLHWKTRDIFTPVHHIDDAFPGWTVATS